MVSATLTVTEDGTEDATGVPETDAYLPRDIAPAREVIVIVVYERTRPRLEWEPDLPDELL